MARLLCVCALAIVAAACSDSAPKPWTAREMNALAEQFGHIAEAYAVVDICIPKIEANAEAKRRVIDEIDVSRYAQLAGMDTKTEFANFLAYHRRDGGTDEQAEQLEQIYRESYAKAAEVLTSLASCEEAVSDYANTILNTKVRPAS